MKFIVVIPVYNAAGSIEATIRSVQWQSVVSWRCVIIDDLSTDGTSAIAERAIAGDDRFSVVRNQEKKYGLRNTVEAIDAVGAEDEDVVVCLDGDDRLAGPVVFDRLLTAYQREGAWMTYGSYIGSDDKAIGVDCSAYPESVHRLRNYRHAAWCASHLKTFKIWLWRRIDARDLGVSPQQFRAFRRSQLMKGRLVTWWRLGRISHRQLTDPSGRYFRRCIDKAMMYPMLEMAGRRAIHIPEVMYIYQRNQASGTCSSANTSGSRYTNRFIRLYLRGQRPYSPLRGEGEPFGAKQLDAAPCRVPVRAAKYA